jgi:hypothetical protein
VEAAATLRSVKFPDFLWRLPQMPRIFIERDYRARNGER